MRIPAVTAADLDLDSYLLDVREPEEFVAGHAPGAVHLPMMDIPARLAEVPAQGEVVVVCRSGHRSAQVVAYLRAQGYENVVNLADGMVGWAMHGRPLVSEGGRVPEIR